MVCKDILKYERSLFFFSSSQILHKINHKFSNLQQVREYFHDITCTNSKDDLRRYSDPLCRTFKIHISQ